MHAVTLKPGREKSLLRKHPWVFSGAVASVHSAPRPGETVQVVDHKGRDLGCGAWSPHSQIRVRMWSFDPGTCIDPDFFRSRLNRALQARSHFLSGSTNACRLVNAESDGLPGLVVDRYADVLVCQFLSTGAEFWKETIVGHLRELTEASTIFERSDDSVRRKEGLEETSGLLHGQEPPELVEVREHGCIFLVDVRRGHKTGFYLDQRDNRRVVTRCAHGARLLNAFSYTGAFGIAALRGGADHVVNIDSSAPALETAARHGELNGIEPGRMTNVKGDVFRVLRDMVECKERFDAIVLDPPKFAESKGQLTRASRGYKDINRLAGLLLHPGGLLITFSCSGLMDPSLFQKIVADGILDAGRNGTIQQRLFQSSCHPTALSFPEGTYLKGLLCRID